MVGEWWKTHIESLPDSLKSCLKMLLVPLFCYVPAFALVWFSFSRFSKVASIPAQNVVQTKIENLVKDEVEKEFTLRRKIPKVEGSALAKEFITGQIKAEAKEEAENAAKDVIDKAKADLFIQMSFPVLFALASVFAAFAVKDILTEILKDHEKAKLKQEVEKELIKFTDALFQPKIADFHDNLKPLLVKIDWLEYKLLDIYMEQVMDGLRNCSKSEQDKRVEDNIAALGLLFDRSTSTLSRLKLSDSFNNSDFERMVDAEIKVFEKKLTKTCLDENDLKDILSKTKNKKVITQVTKDTNVQKSSSKIELEAVNDFTNEFFKIQIIMVINTLRKIQESVERSGSEYQEIEDLIKVFRKQAFSDKASKREARKQSLKNVKRYKEKYTDNHSDTLS
jgi:hypothetical protein